MLIGDRLRSIRGKMNLSQDIEKRTGLLRCYLSRVENGHTVPAVESIEKLALALDVLVYKLFYDGEKPLELHTLPKRRTAAGITWGSTGKDASFLAKLRRLLDRTAEQDRKLLLSMAQKIATHMVAY